MKPIIYSIIFFVCIAVILNFAFSGLPQGWLEIIEFIAAVALGFVTGIRCLPLPRLIFIIFAMLFAIIGQVQGNIFLDSQGNYSPLWSRLFYIVCGGALILSILDWRKAREDEAREEGRRAARLAIRGGIAN